MSISIWMFGIENSEVGTGITVLTEALINLSSDKWVLSGTSQSKLSTYSLKYALENGIVLMNLKCTSEILSQFCLSKERSFINLSSS